MPLSFESISHGTIAFGFFNIESDMLLLEHYFVFATDFCLFIEDMAVKSNEEAYKNKWPVYVIEERENIGDLMGAIHGTRHTGFIGDVYRRFPFPNNIDNFKQKPAGNKSQALIRDIILRYARQIHIPVRVAKGVFEIDIGQYRFSSKAFQDLVKYVWRGGYPRWKDELPPDYVLAMKDIIEDHRQGLFEKIQLE
jgi:hypothetical protein